MKQHLFTPFQTQPERPAPAPSRPPPSQVIFFVSLFFAFLRGDQCSLETLWPSV